jgi:hypothetical protein
MEMKKSRKEVYEEMYPAGTIIELTAPIEDPYSPKEIGDRFKVVCLDDMLQLHGAWLAPAKGSIAVVIGQDSFKVVSKGEEQRI